MKHLQWDDNTWKKWYVQCESAIHIRVHYHQLKAIQLKLKLKTIKTWELFTTLLNKWTSLLSGYFSVCLCSAHEVHDVKHNRQIISKHFTQYLSNRLQRNMVSMTILYINSENVDLISALTYLVINFSQHYNNIIIELWSANSALYAYILLKATVLYYYANYNSCISHCYIQYFILLD